MRVCRFIAAVCFLFFLFLSACGDSGNTASSQGNTDVNGDSPSSSSTSSDIPSVTGNLLTDSRDGQSYKTIIIGSQTWMAQNLNYAYTGVPYNYGSYTSDSTSWCYGNEASNCTKYGRLYTWAAAITACPEGWHLPTQAEFEALFTAVGGQSTAGKVLKSTSVLTSSGKDTDAYAFSALPAGNRNTNGDYIYKGNFADFWSSTENGRTHAYGMNLDFDIDVAKLYDYYDKSLGFSVRCVKD